MNENGTEVPGCPQPPPVAGRVRAPRGLSPKARAKANAGVLARMGKRAAKADAAFAKKQARGAVRAAKQRQRALKRLMRRNPGVPKAPRVRVGPSYGGRRMRRSAFLTWATRKLLRLLKLRARRSDGRNHGFTKSGKGGRTGRAGYHK